MRSKLLFLCLALVAGAAPAALVLTRPGSEQATILSVRPPSDAPVTAVASECPAELTAQKPSPGRLDEVLPVVNPTHLPDGFQRVEDFVEDKSFVGLWSPPLPDDLEQALVPPREAVQLYAPGKWAEADRYLTIVALPVSRELGCVLLRSAAAEDRVTGPAGSERGGTEPQAWQAPPTEDPAQPRARAVVLRGTTAILTPAEAPTHLGRLVRLESDDLLVQVLAGHVADDEVVAVAEGLELTPAP